MFFEKDLPSMTVMINVEGKNGQPDSFGTGFWMTYPVGNSGAMSSVLITNKHVLPDNSSAIALVLRKKDSNENIILGSSIVIGIDAGQYFHVPHPSPTVDLACIFLSGILNSEAHFRSLTLDFIDSGDLSDLHVGQSILFAGYPTGYYDKHNNLPLIRSGSIASIPEVDFDGRGCFMVDAQVHAGSSGSPVFTTKKGQAYLVGVISERVITTDNINYEENKNLQVSREIGLGIVIKGKLVLELINHAKSEAARLFPLSDFE